ncbi:MAG: thioredoxin family protein [Candidatus Obscuribacterales bacterium]|nr:thioredoxin family protein [Candidatus Obscuribacterales bacterium]
MKLRHPYIGIVLSLMSSLSVSCFATGAKETGAMLHANYEHPGSAIDLKSFLSKENDTVLFIHSPHCGPCKKVEPKMKKLAKARTDLKIVDLLLDAPSSKGIGWDSDAAKQFDIHAVPYYLIYDPSGKKLASGDEAETKIESWMKAVGIKVD